MLPSFLIIGAEKAATTWLATALGDHPQVFLPNRKEIYFFSTQFHRGVEWYESYFAEWSGVGAAGEATPVYLSHPEAPARIRATIPDVRLLASLRHPVDRAYSAFWHNLRRGRLPISSDFRACFVENACELRSRGYYGLHLARYRASFPAERLLVLLFDDIRTDPAGALNKCLRFLDLREQGHSEFVGRRMNERPKEIRSTNSGAQAARRVARRVALSAMDRGVVPRSLRRRFVQAGRDAFERISSSAGQPQRPYESLDPSLGRELFENYYAEDVRHLEQLLERQLDNWTRGRSAGEGSLSAP